MRNNLGLFDFIADIFDFSSLFNFKKKGSRHGEIILIIFAIIAFSAVVVVVAATALCKSIFGVRMLCGQVIPGSQVSTYLSHACKPFSQAALQPYKLVDVVGKHVSRLDRRYYNTR